MTIKLVTYARVFYPFVMQTKIPSSVAVYLVVRGDKLLKRSFTEILDYTSEYSAHYSELDAFEHGLLWIVNNIPDANKERLDVVFSGSSRNNIKNDIEKGATLNGYLGEKISKLLLNFDSVTYSAQGKIYSDGDDNNMYNLYDFANKVFEMYYGRDNGFMHQVYDTVNKQFVLMGEPEIRHGNESPKQGWS